VNIQDIQLIYDYNYWANGKILAAAANVSDEQFVAPAPHSHGGLQGTLMHIVDTEYGWRTLFETSLIVPELKAADFPALGDVAARWREEEAAMRAYLARLGDADLLGLVRYDTDTGAKRERVLWHCLLHVANHGTQHRSEAAAILTSLGHSPGDVDFTVFLNERASPLTNYQ
jgi:uncharacterized damage-inducible protein DinB